MHCTLKSKESIVCQRCYMRSYCSEVCKRNDWDALHSTQCKKHGIKLEDFTLVPDRMLLGRGTYGEVQLILNKETKELYALKRIKKITKDHKVPIKLLYREISVQQKLSHPNITRLFDHYETPNEVFLFLEYIDGGNLYSQIKKKIKLPEREASKYFYQICQGVEYLHRNNIIHRDLKPDNILVSRAGSVKICDFGWAISASEERKTYCGTLDYMAPEIMRESHYSNKVDIWSLGIILFELLQGNTPFRGRSTGEKLRKMINREIEFVVGISNAAKGLILKMLEVDPEQRLDIKGVLENDWIFRYVTESPRGSHSRRSSGVFITGDEFDLKLSKNYPACYKRKEGFSSKIPSVFLSTVDVENEDSNSNNSSYADEGMENKVFSVSSPGEVKKKEEELRKLQVKLEGHKKKKKTPSPKGFFSKMFSVFGLG